MGPGPPGGARDPDGSKGGGRTDGTKRDKGGVPPHTTRTLVMGTPGGVLRTQGLQGGRTDGKGEGEGEDPPPTTRTTVPGTPGGYLVPQGDNNIFQLSS